MSGGDPLELVDGVRRVRPDDHFMVLTETDASPMHVGALVVLDVPHSERAGLAGRIRHQFAARLPATPLLARLVEAPDGFDSDVWVDLAAADLDALIVEEGSSDLGQEVARINLQRLDLTGPPFKVHVFPDAAAFYLKMHHCVADGIGFQEVLRLLSDDNAPVPPRSADARLPGGEEWRALSEARFAAEAQARSDQVIARKAALAELEAFTGERAETPQLKLSGPTTAQRGYATTSVALKPFRAAAQALDATVNDLFLACAAWALRDHLLAIDDLPATPLVVNSARSYRRPEHGRFGNRIVAIHPHLATHLPEPIERLRAIQASMACELRRTALDEALLDALEKPYGARDRRAAFADRTRGGGRVLPGNVTLSNVPGPGGERRWAGYRQVHNFPVPIIGSGRFLNITSRRSGANLDMGVIADAGKIADVERIARRFEAAVAGYAAIAGTDR
ncbi:WS/DGAT/MGAT family acyltransferase [Novosphingobium kunmingense]|uniref:diacylglycerol O-acyltransferase n=1 Tax=Novosphingobium kunmingense TaxID=1211806 RepID=A0A2N0H625_9SPHN|nr:wax ester/triacylglycerol synthase domain-containing protein [Novosphingobium kunmingense]PKB14388.1 WS/DGAT/MGAT family acyltransferase [Novosphingobium kunmingense]